MDSLRVLNYNEVRSLLTVPMALEAVESAYVQKARGTGSAWPLLFHEFAEGIRDMDLKSGNLDGDGVWGLKVISCYQDNPQHDLPVYHYASLVFDFETGAPKAVLNAGPVTSFRTGAAGALGARVLARPESHELLMCGTGGIAPYAIAATLIAMPGLRHVTVVNPHRPETTESRLSSLRSSVATLLGEAGKTELSEGLTQLITASDDLESSVRGADVIITATPAYKPYIQASWVRPGTHISCLGADKPGKQEIDEQILADARVVVDDEKQAVSVGECEKAHASGLLSGHLDEMGAVLLGETAGRSTDEQITVFDSSGLALQDLATFSRVIAAAEERGIGTLVTL